MVLPLTTTTAAEAYASIRSVGREMHGRCEQLQAQLDAGTVYPAFLLDVAEGAMAGVMEVSGLRMVPGLNAYAASQLGDPTIDLTPPLVASVMALAGLAGAIAAEYPKSADGFLADRYFDTNGRLAWSTIPATQLPQTAAATTAFLATVA